MSRGAGICFCCNACTAPTSMTSPWQVKRSFLAMPLGTGHVSVAMHCSEICFFQANEGET